MKKYQVIICCLSIFFTSFTVAETEVLPANKKRPVIGLVLSGGGARGATHLGVIKVLEELRIPVDIITGTSMGAIVGGLYAYGHSPEELEQQLINTDWNDIFIDKPPREQLSFRRKQDDFNFMVKLEAGFKDGNFVLPTGLIYGQKLDLLLKSLTPSAPKKFDALNIRFRAVAQDIETDEQVIMGDGSLVKAMRASMSIPGVFTPVEREGRLLVDGGFINNIPVKLAQELGADILIVVDLSGEPPQRDKLLSPLSILNQNLGFMIQRNTRQQLSSLTNKDILLQPKLEGFSSTDFWRAKEMIAEGVTTANSYISQLSQLSVSESEYQEYLDTIRRKETQSPQINNIEIKNNSILTQSVIRSFISIQQGDILNLHVLERDLQQLYGLNIFERISYEVIDDDDGVSLIINAKKKDWGPNYLRFGINLESDFEGRTAFNMASSLTVTPVNRRGGEWRTELQLGYDQYISTEFYQPIDNRLRYFISARAQYSETHFLQFENGEQLADYKIKSSNLQLRAGRDFGNSAQIVFGLTKGKGDTNLLIGSRPAPESDFNNGAWFTSFNYDQLDSVNFPKNGALGNVTWYSNKESLGADANNDSLGITALWAGTWDTHTIILWGGVTGVVNSNVPTNDAFAIGGLFNLSGHRKFEITGRYSAVARMLYYKEIGNSKSIFRVPVYIGGSLETGNAWNDENDINADSLITAGSLILAFDTPIGPLYLAQGFADGGNTTSYLFLGRTFTFF